MPVFLKTRAAEHEERMDDLTCDPQKLHNTYAQFGRVNRAVSGWRRVYARYLRTVLEQHPCTLLDVGFGGGDIPARLARWAARDEFTLHITAIDPDPRALSFVQAQPLPENITFRATTTTQLVSQGERFDIVVSNHLLHHLEPTQLQKVCEETRALSRGLVLHNDLARADLAYGAFALTKPLFQGSFINEDGLTSIRRAYTRAELCRLAPPGWRVEGLFPYRNLLIYEP